MVSFKLVLSNFFRFVEQIGRKNFVDEEASANFKLPNSDGIQSNVLSSAD